MPGFSNPFYSSSSSSAIPPATGSAASHPTTPAVQSPPPTTTTTTSGYPYSYSSSSLSGAYGAHGGGVQNRTQPQPPSYTPSLPHRPASNSNTGASGSGSGEPARYTSLADLSRGRAVPPPPPPPPASSQQGAYGAGGRGDGRYMSPAPGNYGVGIPAEPPRRTVAPTPAGSAAAAGDATTKPGGAASYIPAGAQGYANQASAYASAGVSRARDGLDGVFTQQRKEQVLGGVTSAAATGAKLLGKGAWQLGKFATGGGK